jgi:nucleotide sugar dehydrogenase
MPFSTNLLTQEIYEIPSDLDDSDEIQKFLARNSNKKIVVVQGLGFVGAVMAIVCANALTEEYAVIGVDLPGETTYWKIRSINDGVFPLIADDPKISQFFENSRKKGNLLATCDPVAYKYADIVIVDVNLDVQKSSREDGALVDFEVDLTGFRNAIYSIANNCRDDLLVLVETTVPPGTCQQVVKPIFERALEARGLPTTNYLLGHSYERVMPGPEYIDSIREFPRVYSGLDDASADAVEVFLRSIIDTSVCSLTRLENTTATEMCKVLENSYRAMNIAFAIEWSRFAEEAGVDLYKMIDAIRVRKTHANLMYPGVGVGGYCLTKDPLLASWARKSLFGADSDLQVSVNSVSLNDQMPRFAYERLVEVVGKVDGLHVVFLGASYRGDVGDTRFTPVEKLLRLVEDAGANTFIHDPFLSYWEEMSRNITCVLDEVLSQKVDIIIISAGHSEYKDPAAINKMLALAPLRIFDTVGLLNDDAINILQTKHTVQVLGRGDL